MSKTKLNKITAADIRKYHPEMIGPCPTDKDYASVANKLLVILESKSFVLPRSVDIRDLALRLTLYLEDVISEGPTWSAFTYLCSKLYGRKLPFFPEEDAPVEFGEYYDGEVNFDDIRFLLWSAIQQSDVSGALINPHNPGVALIAIELYDCLLDNFEKQPINPLLNAVFDYQSGDPYEKFLHFRSLMKWIYSRNYLLTNIGYKTDLAEKRKLIKAYFGGNADNLVLEYTTIMESLFTEVCGPLSLYPKQWLAAMMKLEGCEPESVRNVADIDYKKIDLYHVEGVDEDIVFMKDCHDEVFDVAKTSFASLCGLREHIAVITSLVKLPPEDWYINGSAYFLEEGPSLSDWREMREKVAYGTVLDGNSVEFVTKERYIECFGGKRHKFFASQREIIKAITPKEQLDNQNEQYQKLLAKADDKTPVFAYVCDDGQLYISEFLADLIPARDNPFRSKTREARDELLCAVLGKEIDPEVIQYIIDKGWAKTLEMNSVKGESYGKKLLQENISFLNRFMHPSAYFARHTAF